MLKKISCYYHTLKYLKPIQWYGQILYRIRRAKIDASLLPPCRRLQPAEWIPAIIKPTHLTQHQTIKILNQEQAITEKNIWLHPQMSKLWLYNLHYFDFLHSQYAFTQSEQLHQLMQRWLQENIPTKGCGWEPYPLSLRIVNWIKYAMSGHPLSADMMHSLGVQIRYLTRKIEIHLLGNHIFSNAKALLFAGLFFTGTEAARWFKQGLRLFERELAVQILPDGGHCELSPMYHASILEDLLDVINLLKAYQQSIPQHWVFTAARMHRWLQAMCHGDEEIAFFNDAALDVAPTLGALTDYQKRLMLAVDAMPIKNNIYLTHSGYYRMQKNQALLLADIAEVGAAYQPGHAHADTLSFEFSLGRERLLVNSGTSCYADHPERWRQRGSGAHNTLVMNHQNSSEIWKSFRVARRAKVFAIRESAANHALYLQASHDGYHHLYQALHTRSWTMQDNRLMIFDQVFGRGKHHITLYFHVHPNILLKQEDEKGVMLFNQQQQVLAAFHTDRALTIVDSSYHPAFNVSIPNKKIVIALHTPLPATVCTTIQWS